MERKTIGRDLSHTTPALPADRADHAATAFWRFSLALYARPGVADALIGLQDRAGLDVNLILFGLWVGTRDGRELGRVGFAAAAGTAAELTSVVANVRALRRQLGGTEGNIRRLRGAVLRLELAGEREVQRRLASLTTPGSRAPGDRRSAALANLASSLGEEIGSAEAAILRRELAALTRRA